MVTTECLFCEKQFDAHYSEIKRGSGVYCSHKCSLAIRQLSGGLNRGSGTMKHRGYILEWAPEHPANVKGYVYQHRLVVERIIGRLLRPDELVHHLDHKKSNNLPTNLQVLSKAGHRRAHSHYWLVTPDGDLLPFVEACRLWGRDRHTVVKRMRRLKISRQEAFDLPSTKKIYKL